MTDTPYPDDPPERDDVTAALIEDADRDRAEVAAWSVAGALVDEPETVDDDEMGGEA